MSNVSQVYGSGFQARLAELHQTLGSSAGNWKSFDSKMSIPAPVVTQREITAFRKEEGKLWLSAGNFTVGCGSNRTNPGSTDLYLQVR